MADMGKSTAVSGTKGGAKRSIYYIILWIIAIIFFLPVLWIALCSFKSADDIFGLAAEIYFFAYV